VIEAQTNATEAYAVAFAQLTARFAQHWETLDWCDGPIAWRFFRRAGEALPHQGWKIHVSASAAESAVLLSSIGPALRELEVSYKVPRRIADIVFLNSGDAGSELLGKVVTIYPREVEHARDIILRLNALWPVSRGPEVQTDLHLRPRSAVSFRYGVFGAGQVAVSSTGVQHFALIGADGARLADARPLRGEQSPLAPAPPVPGCAPETPPVRINERVTVGDCTVIALAQLSETPRALTWLCANAGTLETVVLKVVRPGVAGDACGIDACDLLGKEYRILTALASDPGVAPRPLGVRASSDQAPTPLWPMLLMEDFRGERLSDLPRRRRIECLPLLADALARIHAAGFVHGDVKLENAVLRGERVGLLDFELAEHAGDPMRRAGTLGHLEPDTQDRRPAAFSRDVYALAGCVVEAVLDVPPALLPAGGGRFEALLANENAPRAATLVADLTNAELAARPTASQAATMLRACLTELANIAPALGKESSAQERAWQRQACLDAARLTGDYAKQDSDGTHWRNTHFMRAFDCEAINLGAAGIILGLATIDTALGRSDCAAQIRDGARWLAARPVEGNAAGLFTGNAGVAVALAVTGTRLGEPAFVEAAKRRLEVAARDRRETDLFSGAAGVVWTACMLSEVLGAAWPLEAGAAAFAHLGEHAGAIGEVPVWTAHPTLEQSFLGCAHGSAGAAMALAYWGRLTNDRASIDAAIDAFRRIVAHGRTEEGDALRIRMSSTRHHAVGNWCHGVGGYLWALLQGVGDEPALSDEIAWAVGCLEGAMSTGTPTYCHGLAGQLELWRMLGGIPRYRALAQARAGKVARALRIMHHEIDGKCTWISDDPGIVTPDLWIGFLGPATALAMHVADIDAPLLSARWLTACSARSDSHE
jgi:hypothetical protein